MPQVPALQTAIACGPVEQTVPQEPQFVASVCRLLQFVTPCVRHTEFGAPQVDPHRPSVQNCPLPQRLPQAPQLLASLRVSMQRAAQVCRPSPSQIGGVSEGGRTKSGVGGDDPLSSLTSTQALPFHCRGVRSSVQATAPPTTAATRNAVTNVVVRRADCVPEISSLTAFICISPTGIKIRRRPYGVDRS
jgi:hypothetical protein